MQGPSSLLKGVYNPKAFIPHAASLRQTFVHCAIFLTAASRRSLARVAVPVWLVVLSDQLPVGALVGRYPANKLIGRELILGRRTHGTAFQHLLAKVLHMSALALLSKSYSPPEGRLPTHYSPVCHFTTVLLQLLVRLACVKRAASVRSEPGSNSQYWNRKTKTQGPPLQYTLFSCQRAEAFASRICDYKKNRDAKSRADISYSISNVLVRRPIL